MTAPDISLQRSVYAALTGAESLSGIGVWDSSPPPGADFPRIVLRLQTGEQADAQLVRIEEMALDVHVFDRPRAGASSFSGTKRVREIMANVDDILHDQAMGLVGGFELVSLRRRFSNVFQESEVVHGVMQYRAVVQWPED